MGNQATQPSGRSLEVKFETQRGIQRAENIAYAPLKPEANAENKANIRMAASALANVLQRMEFDGYLGVETGSVYGAALAIPQIARSVRWHKIYLALAIRSYMLLALNFVLQSFLISFIGTSQIMDTLSGKMHLCDYGQWLETCPDGDLCTGPAGTTYTRLRLYSFAQWSVRTFVRDMMMVLDPAKKDEIMEKVDPGEYGMESYSCRIVCCLVFTLSITTELFKNYELARLLVKVPTKPESWIKYTPYSESDGDADFLAVNLCEFQIKGMPLKWKIANVLIILIPKFFLWLIVVWEGFRFLMETAGIVDLVLGSMAMGFILSIDEAIMDCLANGITRHIMKSLGEVPCFTDPAQGVTGSDEEVLKATSRSLPMSIWQQLGLVLPRRLVAAGILLFLNRWRYYYINCHVGPDGSYVSNPMYLPKHTTPLGSWRELFNLLFFEQASQEEEPFWTNPG